MLMHRFRYTKLTKEQIDKKLSALITGPECASDYSDLFSGKSIKIVTDKGPVLEYSFMDKNRISLTENSDTETECRYGALTLKHIAFLSHMIPGTQKGYNIILDLNSNLATVIEVWFCGYEDNREVQREIYYGYVDTGSDVPEERHHITNRLSGKGFHWTDDRGTRTLEFFPSVTYSSFVELTRQNGELTFCAPSDFIQVDENIFLYNRIECEFSGIMTMYIVDLFSLKQAGVRLGFNERDELEYYMFRGTGKITGQIAQYQLFNDHGKEIIYEMNMPPLPEGSEPSPPLEEQQKGFRPVYRPFKDHPPLSAARVQEIVEQSPAPFGDAGIMDVGMNGNKMPTSNFLVEKELTVRYDNGGPVWKYKFDEIKKLRYCCEGEDTWHEEPYEAFEPAEGMIAFCNPRTDAEPHESVYIVLDFTTGLTTCVYSKLGSKYMANEVSQDVLFGIIEMDGIKAPDILRHKFTDELVGSSFAWAYSDFMTSIHVYTTPFSYTWTIFYKNNVPGMMWSSPCKYVKLRDEVYLFTWVEEACNGSQGTMVFNKNTMHDCGCFYGVNEIGHAPPSGLTLGSFGALARHAGYYDIKKYF